MRILKIHLVVVVTAILFSLDLFLHVQPNTKDKGWLRLANPLYPSPKLPQYFALTFAATFGDNLSILMPQVASLPTLTPTSYDNLKSLGSMSQIVKGDGDLGMLLTMFLLSAKNRNCGRCNCCNCPGRGYLVPFPVPVGTETEYYDDGVEEQSEASDNGIASLSNMEEDS